MKLPHSPYLYTEWKNPEERISQTLYTEAQMREMYQQGLEDAALEFDRRDKGIGFYEPSEPAKIIRALKE